MTGPSRKLALASGFAPPPGRFISSDGERPERTAEYAPGAAEEDAAGALAAIARAEYASRRRRDGLFRAALFAEPAWDMLLDLYVQQHQGRPVSVHSLCVAGAVPQTTALRWIGKLEQSGLVTRAPCTYDNRVIHMSLTGEGLTVMERYLRGQLGATATPAGSAASFS